MTLLLLAGTGEARDLARLLATGAIPTIASLSGAVQHPAALDVPTRVGGFGGAAAFAAYLRDAGITAILDATHPFACHISHRSAEIAADLAIPYARFDRPAWRPGPQDHWQNAASAALAIELVPRGAHVFLATGAKEITTYAALSEKARMTCRRVDAVTEEFPLPNGAWIIGRGPFDAVAERDLFQKLRITHVLCKNAGGEGARAKLTAARELGLGVIMIDRPPVPKGARLVHDIPAAMAWVASVT